MRKILLISLAIVLCSCIKEKEAEPSVSYLEVGDKLPMFTALSAVVSSESFDSDKLKGKVSMIVLFNYECEDCQRELPKLQAVWEELKDDENFHFASFARDKTASEVTKYWEDNHFTMPVYLDTDRAIFNLFAKNTIPRVYISDRNQNIVWIGVDKITLSTNELVAMIRDLEQL